MNKRLFVAIEFPSHIKEELERVQQNLASTHAFKGIFVAKDQLHLTLKFIGNVTEDKVDAIIHALNQIGHRQELHAHLGSLGVFPSREFINIIWAELVAEGITQLAQDIDQILEPFVAREKRSFASHITLARVKSVASHEKLLSYIDNTVISHHEFIIPEFTLQESVLTSHGSIYTRLESFKLTSL